LAAVPAGCGGGSSGSSELTVVAAFYPLAFAAREIAGDRAQVVDLTPAGAEPHDLELSAGDARTLQRADVVLYFGRGFQPALERALDDVDGDKIDLLATEGLRLRDNDPHVWLDPGRFAKIALRIGDALGRRDPAERLAARLQRLDRELARGLRRCERRELVTSHEAFAYLAERYGLEQVAVTGLSPEAEPSPQELRRVIERVRQTKATTVFVETLVSPRLAQTVARETGAKTEVLDPIEGLTKDELATGDDYFSLMRRNLARLRKALGCR
jgi:zinc transport system substrate-binding protein